MVSRKQANEFKNENFKLMSSLTNKEEVLQIMRIIWTSKTKQQIASCENMVSNFTLKVGEDNIGCTLLDIEIQRQKIHLEIYYS